ncbi:hypothetical protein PILCRDRAFT_826086 [Piloderma croceum F 1598]|uniref:Uncharacterized protein n=1 Tax=Piloderma croceum (strain F 1598) TaxID=765440 RepID=A0A0C3BH76_PILCF|nr:hypothetical protein PILCRDRAFT_826086 [Piloderma croceum F 1598]
MSDVPGYGCAGALFGPIFTKWYQLLNKIQFPSATKATAYRVALDQGVATPAHIAFFFTSMTLLEGHPFSYAQERLNHAYQPTLLRNWAVFLPTQIINFGIVPHQLRFLVVGVVSLFWNTYLSAVNAQQKAIEEESDKLG